MLMVKARTATTGNVPGPWVKYLISSISVNQGGQAFLNAAPPEMFQADYYYKTGKMPRRGYQVGGGASSEIIEEIPILFGEGLIDLEHTIDLSRLNDPKLSITYDLAATGPDGGTVWDTTYYPRFTVVAYLIQGIGIPASKGYYSLRQIESYTPADSEVHKLELKGLRPIKRIYCQFDRKDLTYGWIHSLDQVRLWGDNEAWVPLIQKCDDWQELIRDIFGLCEVDGYVYYAANGKAIDICVDRRVNLSLGIHNDYDTIGVAYSGSGRGTVVQFRTIADGSVAGGPYIIMFRFIGYTPWSVQVIDMEKMLNMEHLDPIDHAPVFLELEHVSNAATIGGPVNIHVSDLVTVY